MHKCIKAKVGKSQKRKKNENREEFKNLAEIGEIYSFIHSRYFYSTSSSLLLFRGTPDKSIDAVSELTH